MYFRKYEYDLMKVVIFIILLGFLKYGKFSLEFLKTRPYNCLAIHCLPVNHILKNSSKSSCNSLEKLAANNCELMS